MVTGIAAAKWLASLAPPREAARIGRPSAVGGVGQHGGDGLLGVHPRPAPDQLRRRA